MCTSLKALGKEILTFSCFFHLIKYPNKEFWMSLIDTYIGDNVFATLTLKLVSFTIFLKK